MRNKCFPISLLVAWCSVSSAYASDAKFSMKECVEASSAMNKNVPLIVDKHIVLDTTFCTPGRLKPVLTYRASMAAPKAKLGNFKLASREMKMQQTTLWCTDPMQLELLKRVDVVNVYYDSNRAYFGQIRVKLADCANLENPHA